MPNVAEEAGVQILSYMYCKMNLAPMHAHCCRRYRGSKLQRYRDSMQGWIEMSLAYPFIFLYQPQLLKHRDRHNDVHLT